MRQYEIDVTEEIIRHAERRNSSHCMITNAIRASIPDATFIGTDLQTIRWTDRNKGKRYVFFTPRSAQQAIVDFDRGIPTDPFRMRLRNPQIVPIRKRIDGRQRSKSSQRALVANDSGNSLKRTGGATPPQAAYPGTRRSFGLRGLRDDNVDEPNTGTLKT